MDIFSPCSSNPSRAPLAAFFSDGNNPDEARGELQGLARAGFGGVTLAMPRIAAITDESSEKIAKFFALLQCCRDLKLEVWLRAPLPDFSRGVRWKFQTCDLSAAQAAQWSAPHEPKILSLVAAPLNGARGAPDWSHAVSLQNLDNPEQRAKLAHLAVFAGARLWLWSEENSAAQFDWRPDLPQLLAQCEAAKVRDAVLGICLDAGQQIESAPDCVPASPTLAQSFAQQHGFYLLPHLPSLVADTGAGAAQVRQQFWQTLARERCAELETLRAFCAESNLQLRGAITPGSPARAISLLGGVPQALRVLDVPGIDISIDSQDCLSARLAAGVAELAGKRGALARIPRAELESQTPQNLLPRLQRLLHCGITIFDTRQAHAQGGAPPIIHEPLIAARRGFNERLARLATALSRGRSGARIGVLWPARSLQAHWHPRGHRITRWVEEDLRAVTQLLDDLHFGFLFVPEDDLCGASISKSIRPSFGGHPEFGCTLRCGQSSHPFEMIIVPSVSCLSRAAWDKLEEFVEAGGKVVCLGLLPRWNEDGRDGEFEARVGKSTMMTVADLYAAYAQSEGAELPDDGEPSVIGFPIVRSKVSGGRLGCYQPRLNGDAADARLRVRQMIADALPPELESGAPDVLLSRRICEDGELVFIVNESEESQRVNVRVRPLRDGAPFRCDALSGKSSPLGEWTPLGKGEGDMDRGLALPLELGAGEAELIWIEYGAKVPHAQRANFFVESFDGRTMRGWATQSGEPLALVRENESGDKDLVRWSAPFVEIPPPIACDEWSLEHMESGVCEFQLRVSIAREWQSCRVFFDIAPPMRQFAELFINGQSLGARAAAPYRWEITRNLRAGEENRKENQLSLRVWSDEAPPVGSARLVAYPIVEITQ